MTKEEAAIVTAYTGFVIGEFSDAHEYMQKIFGGPIWTHELGDKDFYDNIKSLAKEDFINLTVT